VQVFGDPPPAVWFLFGGGGRHCVVGSVQVEHVIFLLIGFIYFQVEAEGGTEAQNVMYALSLV